MLLLAAALSQVIVPVASPTPVNEDPCSRFQAGSVGSDAFDLHDQATLADLGSAELSVASQVFGLAPDQRRIALVVTRANPALNAYCQQLIVLDLRGQGEPREIDRGGEFIRDDYPLRNFSSVMAGWARPNPPSFSPDGTTIAYLKRIEGSTQIWIAFPGGDRPARQATWMSDDVDSFAWSADGSGFIVRTRPELSIRAEAIAAEGASGFLFDDRFSPQIANRPIPVGEVLPSFSFVDLESATVRQATTEEIQLLVRPKPDNIPERALNLSTSSAGAVAWVEPEQSDRLIGPTRLTVMRPDGERLVCASLATCDKVQGMWWSDNGMTLVALLESGWANSGTSLLRWDLGQAQPEVLLETQDILVGCALAGPELLCGREGSSQPRHLVAINTLTAAQRIIFDPNPEVRDAIFGEVRRLRFRNSFGTESFADLVLPPDHREGQQHPLVVVQYSSEGFLRGGTGDEVPIHPLAIRGFAVLSFDRPSFTPAALEATSAEELRRLNRTDWLDRRSVHSSLETAVSLAIETGTVDPDRMGISGFSDGGSTVQWALVNSDMFKVASMGSCCEDLYSFPTAAGPGFTRFVRDMGYRYFEPGVEQFWEPMSLILNVGEISIPILIQAADSEYEGGLDVVETFSSRGRPIELFVFPGETHIKWQPAHRLAIYERTTDWFEFWLRGRKDCDPKKAPQYGRWQAMAGAPQEQDLVCINTAVSGP